MKERSRALWWVLGLLSLIAGLNVFLSSRLRESPLARDFRAQCAQGITFFFQEGMDDGIYVTLKGSSAAFHYLDGLKADGSLQQQTDVGTFTFIQERVRIHGKFLKGDLILSLHPAQFEHASGMEKIRFQLIGPDIPLGGWGPCDLPMKPNSRN